MRHEQDRSIVEKGHSISVVSCKTFKAPVFERMDGIEVYRVPALVLPVLEYPLPNLILMCSWVAHLLKSKKVDVVHVEDGAYLTSLLVLFVKKVLKKPVILSMQGFPGLSWFYGSFFVDLMAKIYALTLGKMVLKTADKVVLSATAFVEDAVRLGVRRDRIAVIHRGVDLKVYHPNSKRRRVFRYELGLKDNDIMILFAGRLVLVKGLRYFVEAAKNLSSQYKRLKFVIAGDGVLRGQYQKETRAFQDSIRFIGYRMDMEDVMNGADIFVLSSISEGCPNAVIEAGACAKPVVATRVGAAPDIIIDGETGLLVKPRSIESLQSGLRKMLDSESARGMGEKALARISKFFSWDTVASSWEKVYIEVSEED